MPYMLLLIALIVLLIAFIIWYISVSNRLNRAIIKIDEANSGIDVALTKRYDVLTKMMNVVKDYARHEKEILFEIVKLRNNMSIEEKSEANDKMNHNLDQIKLLAENYPELRSSENYKTLQQAISDVEEHLQAARRMYNSNVSILNQSIVTFPDKIVAGMKRITKRDFFEAEESKRQDVDIDL